MTPFLFVARIWKVLYHECIGKTILPTGVVYSEAKLWFTAGNARQKVEHAI